MGDAYLFDTSALFKRYHTEVGSQWVSGIFALSQQTILISDLSVIEFHSVLAKKVRTGEISRHDANIVLKQFGNDYRSGLFTVVRIVDDHKMQASRLLLKHGFTKALRTLDALQLSVAVSLQAQGRLAYFVVADANFAGIAQVEGITVINPEHPIQPTP